MKIIPDFEDELEGLMSHIVPHRYRKRKRQQISKTQGATHTHTPLEQAKTAFITGCVSFCLLVKEILHYCPNFCLFFYLGIKTGEAFFFFHCLFDTEQS